MSKFYCIGVGSGDPELLTIKAKNILENIDVILMMRGSDDKKSIVCTIIEDCLNSEAEKIFIDYPMQINHNVLMQMGENIASIISENVENGKNVALAILGDPSVYSTYGYVLKNIPPGIPIETVPGVTSFCAAAAITNRPLVETNEILSIIPLEASSEKIDSVLMESHAIVMMKLNDNEEKAVKFLEKYGLDSQGVLVQRCGFSDASVKEEVIDALKENKERLSILLTRKDKKE